MKVNFEKLIAMKIFVMGRGIAERKIHVTQALKIIESAIDFFDDPKTKKERLILLFYILLKSEILRGTSSISSLSKMRLRAKEISLLINSQVYKNYMKIEDASQDRHKAHGIQAGVIGNEGINRKVSRVVEVAGKQHIVSTDAILEALNVQEIDLSEKQSRFIYQVNLMQLLEMHGVPYPKKNLSNNSHGDNYES